MSRCNKVVTTDDDVQGRLATAGAAGAAGAGQHHQMAWPTSRRPVSRWLHRLLAESGRPRRRWRRGHRVRAPRPRPRGGRVVSCPAMAREVLRSNDAVFADRPATFAAAAFSGVGYRSASIAPAGDQWWKMRRVLTADVLAPPPCRKAGRGRPPRPRTVRRRRRRAPRRQALLRQRHPEAHSGAGGATSRSRAGGPSRLRRPPAAVPGATRRSTWTRSTTSTPSASPTTSRRSFSFSTGRRGCPGLSLGTLITVMLLARLLQGQGFHWSNPPGVDRIQLRGDRGEPCAGRPARPAGDATAAGRANLYESETQ